MEPEPPPTVLDARDAREAYSTTFGAVLTLLSDLERSGHAGAVAVLRERLRDALHDLSLDDACLEIAAVRHAAEALRCGA